MIINEHDQLEEQLREQSGVVQNFEVKNTFITNIIKKIIGYLNCRYEKKQNNYTNTGIVKKKVYFESQMMLL